MDSKSTLTSPEQHLKAGQNTQHGCCDNNHLFTYCQPVCYFQKNTTIPCKEYLQYPVKTTYNMEDVINPYDLIKCLCRNGKM